MFIRIYCHNLYRIFIHLNSFLKQFNWSLYVQDTQDADISSSPGQTVLKQEQLDDLHEPREVRDKERRREREKEAETERESYRNENRKRYRDRET